MFNPGSAVVFYEQHERAEQCFELSLSGMTDKQKHRSRMIRLREREVSAIESKSGSPKTRGAFGFVMGLIVGSALD